MPDRHVVLIHGAWAGSWVWDGLLDGLRDAGFKPHAIDLPGNGSDDTPASAVSLDLYAAHVAALIDRLEGPVHLVAHSGGGLTATAVGERCAERIAGVTYVAGMMLPSSVSFADACAELVSTAPEVSGVGPFLQRSVDGLGTRVPAEIACALFFHDVPLPQALAAAQRLCVQPDGGRAVVTRWTNERFGRLPRLYIECSTDRSVVPAVQRWMQEQVPGAERVVLDCGHAPQLATPEALLAALLPFFSRHPDSSSSRQHS
ncbi:alpha/beta fold hydrolase [Pseudomonas stutzeri]|uniref:alpha/beta fold hydrolase n=1 Tax=Stutzerimonas stutzeri TaxID=316 RepID=UPI00210EB393|nr:alpha/beta fold hydrolase [Stutzerimonas stutzeri]MCQ4313497.1 alpha/beta fold hydrolase [Stutzerimonas stutzeri]